MARLVIKSDGFRDGVIELNLGVNRFGRNQKCDFPIDHATVSAHHCEIVLSDDGVTVRDCDSTNGIFLDGKRVQEAKLAAGQTLHIGDVELLVETTEVTIQIPKFDMPHPAPPVVLSDGSLICPRHPHSQATHHCTHCREVLCDACVHYLRRRGGKVLKLCPLCSHPCELIGVEVKKKKSLFRFLHKTVKLPFIGHSRRHR
jgi:pSer/pThr/pTyr-binding forkhead associated (FHA) protein